MGRGALVEMQLCGICVAGCLRDEVVVQNGLCLHVEHTHVGTCSVYKCSGIPVCRCRSTCAVGCPAAVYQQSLWGHVQLAGTDTGVAAPCCWRGCVWHQQHSCPRSV